MALLNNYALADAGAFTPAQPERREIHWSSQDEAGNVIEHGPYTVYVRHHSMATSSVEMQLTYAEQSQDASQLIAARIVACLADEQGTPLFSMADILGNQEHGPICDELATALLAAIADVNGGAAKKNSSARTMKSGVNSSSPASAATPSPTRKPRSRKTSSSPG